MALHYRNEDKIGKMTIKDKGKEHDIDIFTGNALAILVGNYKDEQGNVREYLHSCICDEEDCEFIMKRRGKLFSDDVVSIELYSRFNNAVRLLPYLVKSRHNVNVYGD